MVCGRSQLKAADYTPWDCPDRASVVGHESLRNASWAGVLAHHPIRARNRYSGRRGVSNAWHETQRPGNAGRQNEGGLCCREIAENTRISWVRGYSNEILEQRGLLGGGFDQRQGGPSCVAKRPVMGWSPVGWA